MKKIIKEKMEPKSDQAIDALFKKKKPAAVKKEQIVIKEVEEDLVDQGDDFGSSVPPSKNLKNEYVKDVKKVEAENVSVDMGDAAARSTKRKEVIMFVSVLLCMGALSLMAYYFYWQYRQVTVRMSNVPVNDAAATKEANSIKDMVGQFIQLPTNEEPILATVTDVEKLKSQKFFANAENGDKVLIYSQNKKAILYRPSTHKVIEFSVVSGLDEKPVTASDSANIQVQNGEVNNGTTATQTTQSTTTNVAVYNGSKVKGLAQKTAASIGSIDGMKVVDKANAVGNYDQTIVVDLSGSRSDAAKLIADKIGGTVSDLPSSEQKPAGADILVICGSK